MRGLQIHAPVQHERGSCLPMLEVGRHVDKAGRVLPLVEAKTGTGLPEQAVQYMNRENAHKGGGTADEQARAAGTILHIQRV